jgi:S-formylglutathione hydrolase FrmB
MSFCQVQWSSRVLKKQVGMFAILPDVGQPPYPTLYLLHGLFDDHTIWQRRTRIEWYVRERPLLVVMPDGFRGFYTNNTSGPDYATYMAEDLIDFVERNLPAKPERAARCVGGASMGGYGALRLALGYPDRYAAAFSHSGALLAGSRPTRQGIFDVSEMQRVFGLDPSGSEHDLIHLARRAMSTGQAPMLRLDCGTKDYLIEDNQEFHRSLAQMAYPHEYEEFPGAHGWDYWDLHVQESLRFACASGQTHPTA